MKIAIIPARGGSKRIPRKNIRSFAGLPMITYSIKAAQAAQVFDRIIVSTDDREIAAVAKECGAEVPSLRPDVLSDEFSTTIDVMAYEADNLSQIDVTAICCIYATAPLIDPDDLINGWQTLESSGADYCFSATEYAFPIQRALFLAQHGGVSMFNPEHRLTRSQDLEPAYHDAGQFYWGSPSAWREKRSIYSENSRMILLPHYRVQDIDTEHDWHRAEAMFQVLKMKQDID